MYCAVMAQGDVWAVTKSKLPTSWPLAGTHLGFEAGILADVSLETFLLAIDGMWCIVSLLPGKNERMS